MKLDLGKARSMEEWRTFFLAVAALDPRIQSVLPYLPSGRKGLHGYVVLVFETEEQAVLFLGLLRRVCPEYAARAEEYCPERNNLQRVDRTFFPDADIWTRSLDGGWRRL